MTRRMTARSALLLLVLVVMNACGVPVDQEPRPIDAPRGPFPDLASAVPVEPGTVSERLCFVRDDMLAAVTRSVRQPVSVATHLQLLLNGPTGAEAATGYTTALTGTNLANDVSLVHGVVTVEVGGQVRDSGRSDDVLAFGQIVCTLTTRANVAAVAFTHEGQHLGVPRADGSLSQGPLTSADYATLLAP